MRTIPMTPPIGLSPISIGSDVAISVRGPGAFTGIAALKATHGRIPYTGHFPAALSRYWHVGPIGPHHSCIRKASGNKLVQTHLAFTVRRSDLKDSILIPKYYDPELAQAADLASADFQLHRIAEFLEEGSAGSKLGVWVRREHYGSGPIP